MPRLPTKPIDSKWYRSYYTWKDGGVGSDTFRVPANAHHRHIVRRAKCIAHVTGLRNLTDTDRYGNITISVPSAGLTIKVECIDV